MIRMLSDKEIAELEFNDAYASRKNECPTCQNTGVYKYLGEVYPCEVDEYGRHTQQLLYRLYYTANIPHEFQVLDWNDYPYPEPKADIDQYIENFKTIRYSGMGWEIYGAQTGVGKTWAATAILKALVREGYSCWFAQFADVRSYHELSNSSTRDFFIGKLRSSEVLVLDEVLRPYSDKQRDFYETKLEEIVRHRTMSHFPTIITTNLVEEEMNRIYPRVYSVLSAKQSRLELVGDDYRIRKAYWDNDAIAKNGEVRPIV